MTNGIRCRMYTDKSLIKVLSNVENYPRQVLNVLCLDITTTSLEWYPCKEFWQWVSSKRGCSCGLQDSNCVKGDRIFCQLSAKFHHIMAIWTLICFKGSSLIHWSWKKKLCFGEVISLKPLQIILIQKVRASPYPCFLRHEVFGSIATSTPPPAIQDRMLVHCRHLTQHLFANSLLVYTYTLGWNK